MLVLDATSVLGSGRTYTLHLQDSASAWSYPEHGHRGFADLLVVERGRIRQRINGTEIALGPGEAVLIRPNDRHTLWGEGFRFHNLNLPLAEWERLAAYVGPDLPLADLMAAAQAPRAHLALGDRQRICDDLAELIVHQDRRSSRAMLARFLLRWLPAFLGQGAVGQGPGAGPAWLAPLLRRIEDGIEQGLSAADLPRHAGVSQAHLSRSFRRHVGTSPSQHLNRVRLQRAAVELAGSNRPVLAIGYGLGFSSPSYFYRLFASAYGLPPAAYRRRHRMP